MHVAVLSMWDFNINTLTWRAVCAQDFRTGYYTLASPKALFTVQVCGAFLGVLYSPAVYTFYNHAFKSALFGHSAVSHNHCCMPRECVTGVVQSPLSAVNRIPLAARIVAELGAPRKLGRIAHVSLHAS